MLKVCKSTFVLKKKKNEAFKKVYISIKNIYL